MKRKKSINLPKKGTQARVQRESIKKVRVILRGIEKAPDPPPSEEEEDISDAESEECLWDPVHECVESAINKVLHEAMMRDMRAEAMRKYGTPLEDRKARDKTEFCNVWMIVNFEKRRTSLWDDATRAIVGASWDVARRLGRWPSLPLSRLSYHGRVTLGCFACSCGAYHCEENCEYLRSIAHLE